MLTTEQMAQFVARGYLRFDAVVPPDVNEQAMVELPALFNSWVQQYSAVAGGAPSATSTDGLTRRSGTPSARGVLRRLRPRADGARP